MNIFCIQKKIYYHDTDCGGVVYYANYLKYLEEGRNEFCAGRGVDLKELILQGLEFPVVHVEVDYKFPAKYGDTVKIFTQVEKIGNSSVHFYQEIRKENITLVKAKTVWACIGKDFQSKTVPQEIKAALLKAK